jgi:hypothetical protein
MIPISHFIHVIQAERQRDLEHWQRARAAALSGQRRAAPSLGERMRTAFGSWRLASRPEVAPASGTERTTGIVACC